MENSKVCTKCKILKLATEFPKLKYHSDGLSSWCKVCTVAYQNGWRRKNVEKTREYKARYFEKHPEATVAHKLKTAEWRRKNKARHLETKREWSRRTSDRITDKRRYRYATDEAHRNRLRDQRNKSERRSWERLRARVILAYGGRCSCCGERRVEFLTLEHVNRDGGEHRKMRGPRGCWKDAERLGFPKNYTILCMNCNWVERHGARCPHKVEAEQVSKLIVVDG